MSTIYGCPIWNIICLLIHVDLVYNHAMHTIGDAFKLQDGVEPQNVLCLIL